MKRTTPLRMLAAFSIAASSFSLAVPAASAGSPHLVPGMTTCMVPGGCGAITPPLLPPTFEPTPPSPPGGGGGGGGGGFGSGLGAGIGMGVGLGIVRGLTQPRQQQVIIQQQPTYVQPRPVYTAPPPRPVANGLSPHDQFCLGKYKSYNIQTKRFLSYSGQYKVCRSPYM